MMKLLSSLLIATILLTLTAVAQNNESQPSEEKATINVSVPEGRVLPIERREDALTVAKRLIDNSAKNLGPVLEEIHNPFIFKKKEVVVAEDDDDDDTQPMDVQAPRNDLEVLRLLAPRLQREIQGSLIMGDRKRLIWSNGSTVEIGFVFKTRISANDPNIYEITITDIREKSFSIQLNDSEIPVPIGDSSSGPSIQRGN